MELLLLREVLVIAATAIAAWTDWKTGNIYDWLTYPLIAIGVVLNLIELNFLGLGLGAGVFAIGYLLYYTGRLGGGDVKLFAGITMALPFLQGKVYIIPVLLYSALIAVMFFSVYYTVKLARLKKLELKENAKGIFNAAIIAIALAAYFYMVGSTGLFEMQSLLIIGIPIAFALLFLAFEKSIRKNFFVKKIALSKLEEDELIAWEFLPEKLQKKLGLKAKRIIDKQLLQELKKEKLKEVLVYRDLPKFAPFILIGAILAILRPEIIAIALKPW